VLLVEVLIEAPVTKIEIIEEDFNKIDIMQEDFSHEVEVFNKEAVLILILEDIHKEDTLIIEDFN
jgi:hypothetical protein